MKKNGLPKPRFLEDLKHAATETEMFSYLVLSADFYKVTMNFDCSYQEMAADIQMQLDVQALDEASSVKDVEALYCMMKMVAVMCERFPKDHAKKQQIVRKSMF